MTEEPNRNSDGTFAAGNNANPTGNNGRTPITDAINVILTRPETDNLDDEPKNNAQRIALEWVKKAKDGKLDAAISLTDRVEGKPAQTLTGKDGKDLIPPPDTGELARRIAFLLSQAKT